MEFTKEKTNITKGIAISLMFLNHLFAFPDRILNGNYYISLIPFFDAEFYVGKFGNVCVSIFIFLSGYGMFLGCTRSHIHPLNYSLKKIKSFYLTYWLYFCIFVPIGLIFFKKNTLWNSSELRYTISWKIFWESFLGWSPHYNSEWWFVRMFVLLLILLCPIYIYLAKRNSVSFFLFAFLLFLFSWIKKIDYLSVYGFMFWQMIFAMGMIFAKLKVYSSYIFRRLDSHFNLCVLFGCLFYSVFFAMRSPLGPKIDFLFVPFFIYFSVSLIKAGWISSVIEYIGRYSFQLWIIHSFFCYYYFQDFIYYLKWSPLVLGVLTITTLISVLAIEYIRSFFLLKLRIEN
jgi:hypothetical protein